jgi:hypothetical protein
MLTTARDAPAIRLDVVRLNASWFAWNNHCDGDAQQTEQE